VDVTVPRLLSFADPVNTSALNPSSAREGDARPDKNSDITDPLAIEWKNEAQEQLHHA